MLEDNCQRAVLAKVVANSFIKILVRLIGISAVAIDLVKVKNACCPVGPSFYSC
jgi:hypothetical protein